MLGLAFPTGTTRCFYIYILYFYFSNQFPKNFMNYGDAISGTMGLWTKYSPVAVAGLLPTHTELQGRLAYMCSGTLLGRLMGEQSFEYLRAGVFPPFFWLPCTARRVFPPLFPSFSTVLPLGLPFG